MSRPMNFLHLTTFYPPYSFGGDAIQLHRLAHALGDSGHHVDVVHCEDSYHLLHPGEPPVKYADHPNVKRHGLRSGYKSLSPLLTQQTGRLFLKRKVIDALLESRPYDVIHFHNISLLGPEVLSLLPSHGQAVKIYTTHEHWLVCPTHVLWKFNQAPCEKPDCLRCTIQAKRPPQLWRYTGLLDQLKKYAATKAISVPTGESEKERSKIKKLLNDKTFDKDWSSELRDLNKETINNFEKGSASLADTQLKEWVTASLSEIRRSHDHIMACNNRLK